METLTTEEIKTLCELGLVEDTGEQVKIVFNLEGKQAQAAREWLDSIYCGND